MAEDLFEHFWRLKATAFFNVTLHVGTLIVVVFYFRREIKGILSALAHLDFESESGRLILPIIVGTVPTAIIGLLYDVLHAEILQTIPVIGVTFLVGATVVYASRIGRESTDVITYPIAFIMGAAQGFAVFPGLSRSGVTISTALLLGLRREKAFKFSFLLSIPAIIGDLGVEAYVQRGQLGTVGIGPIEVLLGIVMAMIAGYVAIKLVSRTVSSRRFHNFAFYTWLLGAALIILTLTGILAT